MKSLEDRVAEIEQRNNRVEQDKKWETSWTRRLAITLLTYAVAATYLYIVNNNSPFVNALVPSGGYFLSTMALKTIRQLWQK